MTLPGAEALVDQPLHRESQPREQIGSGPVERFADRRCIGDVCFNADDAKARADKMDRRSHAGESASNDGDVYLVWIVLARQTCLISAWEMLTRRSHLAPRPKG